VLARIDDRDFRVALEQAKADVAAAQAAVASKQAQLDIQQAVIAAAKATVEVDVATKTFASQENKRYSDLAATGYGSVQNAQQAQAKNAGADAAIMRDKANLVSAEKQVELLKAEIAQAIATSSRAAALQRQAELNLSYTTITAPIDGVVGNRTLRVGQFVQAGTQLMSLVPSNGAYVIANFKETQLGQVRAGQRTGIRTAAARQRHRQLHQGGSAHPREDPARRSPRGSAAGHVGHPKHPNQIRDCGSCPATRPPSHCPVAASLEQVIR